MPYAPPSSAAAVDVPAWRQRLFAADKLAEQERPIWTTLERAADGLYPGVCLGHGEDTYLETANQGRGRSGDQIDINLIGRALRKRSADFYDRFPTRKFAKRPSDDPDVVDGFQRLVDRLMDEGDAMTAERRAMESAHTRGVFCVWPMFRRSTITESEIVAGKTDPGEFVESVLAGNEPYVPLGADYEGIARATQMWLSPKTADGADNPSFYGLEEWQRTALTLLFERAQRAQRAKMKPPHAIQPRAHIYFEATPYGSWCLVDASVTDYSKVGWVARKVVMTKAEFRADPTFTDEAKDAVCPVSLPKTDGGVPVPPDQQMSANGRVADEEGRVTLWEIYDRIGWQRIYIADGHDKPVGKSTRYPYMDIFGRPLFPDFFPCVWRTPWTRMTERPSRVLGLPGLEPMWAPQIEYIKCVSAFVTACKSTARIFLVGPGVSNDSLEAVAKGQDSTFVKLTSEYSPQAHGDPSKQFSQLPMAPAPQDFLIAAEKVKHEAYESVALSSASMTSSPQAPTATQEALIGQGAATVEGDIRGCFESADAELAWKALLMFLSFANQQEFESYLGEAALKPRPPLEPQAAATAPVAGGDGASAPPPPPQMRESVYEAMLATDLVGERLESRFASSTQQQDALRLKTLQDILATVHNVRDGANMPYVDPRDIIRTLTREAGVEAVPYKPTEGEIALQVAALLGNRGGAGEDGEDDGGHSDDRRAGGERGKPTSPGRHTRGQHAAGASGNRLRRAHSTNQ